MSPLPTTDEEDVELSEHESKGLLGSGVRDVDGGEAVGPVVAKKMRIGSRKGDIALLGALCSSVFFSGCLSALPSPA